MYTFLGGEVFGGGRGGWVYATTYIYLWVYGSHFTAP